MSPEMARPGLFSHRKFHHLSALLGAPYRAAGVLEMLWRMGYESGDPCVGPAIVVEAAVGWDGERGVCAAALEAAGFLDRDGDMLVIHDLDDHAPEYVKARARKERQRRRSRDDHERVTNKSRDENVNVTGHDRDCHPTPTPAPAPTPKEEGGSEPPLASPDWPVFRCRASSKSQTERRWTLGDDLVESLQKTHPQTDVLASLRDLHGRLNTGAQSLRTQRGMPAFASKWVANDATWGNHRRRNGSPSPTANGYATKAKALASRWEIDLSLVEGYIRETGQTPTSADELREWTAAQGV